MMRTLVLGGFEASNIYNISEVRPNRFACEMKPEIPSVYKYPDHHGYWFFLKVENAKGKEVIIDIKNCDWMPSHWKHYKPVVNYCDPNHLNSRNWEKIYKTSRFRKTFSFRHTYINNLAWVALRYPYTYSYHQKYLTSIENSQFIKKDTIYVTREGRKLDTITITDYNIPLSNKKKIVIYAREHGNEQEGSWVCQGIIKYLLSNSYEAEALRKEMVFLIIPISMPDAAFHGRCTDPFKGNIISCDFYQDKLEDMRMDEAASIWSKIIDMTENHGNVDICISLHSPHGWEENIWSNLHDTINWKEGKKLNESIFACCKDFTKRGPEYRWGKFSLPGRCAKEFGSIAMLLEINQHAKKSFLSIDDLHKIGEGICKGILNYYE